MSLHLPPNVGRETRDETRQEKWWWQANDSIRQILEFKQVIRYRTRLCEFEEHAGKVVVLRRHKPCL